MRQPVFPPVDTASASRIGVALCPCPPAHASDNTRSSPSWVRAVWARSTGRATIEKHMSRLAEPMMNPAPHTPHFVRPENRYRRRCDSERMRAHPEERKFPTKPDTHVSPDHAAEIGE